MSGWEAFGRYMAWCAFWMALTIALSFLGERHGWWSGEMSSLFDFINGMLCARYFWLRERIQ